MIEYMKFSVCTYIYIYIEREKERERERWIQVTFGVTLKSYTFSKPLDFSKSNSKKNALINTVILIRISFIIFIYNIPYLSLISKICIFFSLLSLSHPLHISLSSIALPSSFSSGFTSIAT